MGNLPKRSDYIYKEIERFEDYEFTNCIAYEMLIRNKELQNTINNFAKCRVINSIDYFNLVDELESFYFPLNYYYTNYKDEEIEYKVLDGLYFDYPFINNNIKSENHFSNSNGMNSVFLYQKKEIRFTKCPFDINQNERGNKCSPSFKRPILIPLEKEDITMNILLNLNLPKDELVAYISKIKDDFDEDKSIIKTHLEILGEVLEKSKNKKINKKLIADKFFIYDYVTARKEEIKNDNELNFQEYEEEIQEIKNNLYITIRDREIQLKELKKEFEENTNTRINELFEDIEDFAPATAKRYYYDIKPFIDDCKYKELITGIKQ